MIVPIKEVGKIGIVTDLPPHETPLNAWTDGLNVRFRGGAVEKFSGHSAIFGTPLFAPVWLLHTAITGTPLWLYASDTKVGATDGTNHADISKAGGSYVANPAVGWTGAVVEGIPVITNGANAPQMWRTPAIASVLQDLTSWPVDFTANAMRVLKSYLVALDVTKVGTRYANLIKWSDRAPTGDVPQSWDETDETKDAGEETLPGDSAIVDGFPLRDALAIYRETETWRMDYVAGIDIFNFHRIFEYVGSISRRSAVEFFSGQHLVFTGDDVVKHDGQQAESVLSERARKLISGKLDSTNYNKSFVSVDYLNTEVWVCFPEAGATYCNKALIWNWVTGTFGLRELPNAGFIAAGIIPQAAVGETWDASVGTWDSDNIAWGDRAADPTKRRPLLCSPTDNAFYILGLGNQFAGVNMNSYVERVGIGFPVEADGPPDYYRYKQVLGLWPRINGTQRGVINVTVGTQQVIGGPTVQAQARQFTIGESTYLDFSDLPASRIHTVRFESNTGIDWRLLGWDADVIDRGEF